MRCSNSNFIGWDRHYFVFGCEDTDVPAPRLVKWMEIERINHHLKYVRHI